MSDLIVLGYDGSPASDHAIRSSAALLAPRPLLVVVVWEPDVAYELPGSPDVFDLAPLNVISAAETDQALYEGAQRLASKGAALAREAGWDADGVTVADDGTVPDTIVGVAQEREAAAIVVGAHGRGRLSALMLGSTSQGVVRRAECPVVVVRWDEG
jgi:nucleotide-binding universal stress UspA family protein